MDDELIDDESLSLARRSLLPGAGFFIPDSYEEKGVEPIEADTAEFGDTVVVVDPDADGLVSAVLIEFVYPDAVVVPVEPHELVEGINNIVGRVSDVSRVFICDLCPDEHDPLFADLRTIVDTTDTVTWFDHHQWDPTLITSARDLGISLEIGESDEECTADVVFRELDADFPEKYRDLVAVTRDHDLWIRDDPRSDDLADFAFWSTPAEFMETVREHGAALPEPAEEFLTEKRETKQALIDRAVNRVDFHEINDTTIGVTYGRCSQNEVAEAIRELGADAVVVVKPAGSASIRGSDSFELCHLVARRVNGGGHPKAAGCKPDIYEDMLDYAHHWTTQGAVAKRVILDAFRETLSNDSDS